jgi:hypothetical protein
MPVTVRRVAQRQARDLDRVMYRHELNEIGHNAVSRVLEPGISPAVAGDVGRCFIADRQCGWAPKIARVVISQIERFTRTISNGIIRPGSELVLTAVNGPGGATAFCRHVEAECGIGDDVDPGGRRPLTGAEDCHIFSAVRGEAAQPVKKLEFRRR